MLNISHIEHNSEGYGKGTRTVVFFKGCSLKCPWCCNPENVSFSPAFMKIEGISEPVVYGREYSVDEVFEEIMQDKEIFDRTNGGVTFSGGECMLHADSILPLAKKLKENGISITIDTAGNVRFNAYNKLNPYVDEYLYDYKTASEGKFSRIVGGDLTLVTDNLKKLISTGANVRIRVPLIPDFNISSGAVSHICDNLVHLGIKDIDLIPFHRDASGKYKALGLDYPYMNVSEIDDETLEHLKSEYKKFFNIRIECNL